MAVMLIAPLAYEQMLPVAVADVETAEGELMFALAVVVHPLPSVIKILNVPAVNDPK